MQLSDYAQHGRVHLTAEFMGRRYYIESGNNIPAMIKAGELLHAIMPRASYYVTERTGISCNGNAGDFKAAYKES